MNSPVLGVDLGKSKTGLAISENGYLARPLRVIKHGDSINDIRRTLLEVIGTEQPLTVVIGLPLHADGKDSEQSHWVKSVVEDLRLHLPTFVTLDFQDEHGTSQDARLLYPDVEEDAAAAAVFLQDYLERHADGSANVGEVKRILLSLFLTLLVGIGLVYAGLILLMAARRPSATPTPSPRADISITIIEGKRREEIAGQMERAGITTAEDFLAVSRGYEGKLFPDTYRFFPDTSAIEVVQEMNATYQKKVLSQVQPTDAQLILASIVEREALTDTDRPIIAGVYANRLKIGMRLESDPTVEYSLDNSVTASYTAEQIANYKYWPKITQDDYRAYPSPFNTYTSDGLPPTPIANPGLKSIEAAMHPASHNYYYFLYKNGKLLLSQTLAQHQAQAGQ